MPSDGAKFLMAISVRTLIVLFSLVIGIRLLGKRQAGQFTVYDLALIMLLANAVQNAMTNGDGHILTGIVSAGTLVLAGWVLTRAFVALPPLQQRATGVPTLLLNDGKFIKDHLRRERVSEEQVFAAIRQHGICDLSQVRLAVLEVDGVISIVPAKALHHNTKKIARRSRRR